MSDSGEILDEAVDQKPTHDLDPLVLDLVEWVAKAPRAYGEVMEAWRTSCPRLTVWEDAVERSFLERVRRDDVWMVEVTVEGVRFLKQNGRAVMA